MASDSAVALVSEDWTPWLVKAPHVIQKLGFCMSLAATREAAEIQLHGSNLESSDLATNLVAVANQGQNAFIEAYSDMLEIGAKTNSMGRIGGTLDQLVELFGDASVERATKRLLERLQSDVGDCDTNGKRTAGDFAAWRISMNTLHKAVLGAQSETTKGLTATEAAMQSLEDKVNYTENDLVRLEEETLLAQGRYKEALKLQEEREATLNSYTTQAAKIGLTMSFGMVGAVIGAGLSSALSASAAKTVANAQSALNEQRKVIRELNHGLKNVEIDLGLFRKEKAGLNHLMKAISAILQLLAGLADNIKDLVLYFNRMNIVIRQLVNEYKKGLKDIANDQVNGVELSEADFKAFRTSALQMKEIALTVHALATLYAKVITDTINPGFGLVVESSRQGGGESAMIVAGKQDDLRKYLEDAESHCRHAALEANQTLVKRLQDVDRTTPANPKKKKEEAPSQDSKKKKGFFSRFRS